MIHHYCPAKKCIAAQIDDFLQMNVPPDVSYSTVWEALKAYLRGQIISYAAYENKQFRVSLTGISPHLICFSTKPRPLQGEAAAKFELNLKTSPPDKLKIS